MADKTTAELSEEIEALRADLDKKANTSSLAGLAKTTDVKDEALKTDTETLATQAWVEQETKSSVWQTIKSPEFLGLATALTIAKLEITSLINIDPAIEGFLKKRNIERNEFGILWKVKAEELERRAREIADAESRLVRMEKGIARLQDLIVSAHGKIRNSNTRIQVLERKVSQLSTRSNTTRQQIRHMGSSPALAGTTDQVTLLERRVSLLAAALS